MTHETVFLVIEIAVGDYPRDLRQLVKAAEKQGQEASVTNWDPLKLNSDKGKICTMFFPLFYLPIFFRNFIFKMSRHFI